jgi:2-oxoglutarate ferredoxin oxidoreductase subunit alpha
LYEHLPDGHTSEDAEVRIQQVNKRDQKIKTYLSQHFQMPTQYGDTSTSNTVLISWGGTKGAILEAQKILAAQGLSVEYLHFSSVYPLHAEQLQPILNQPKKYIVIENNMTNQFAQLLKMTTGFIPTNTISVKRTSVHW